MNGDNFIEKFNSKKLDFMSRPQFKALNDRFENTLLRIKDDLNLKEFATDFSYLLQVFQACFKENERKTQKILELKVLSDIKSKKENLADDTTTEDLKREIGNLQRNLDKTNKERIKYLREVEELKKTVDTQNVIIQVREKSLEHISADIGSNCAVTFYDYKTYEAQTISEDFKAPSSSKKGYSEAEMNEKGESSQRISTNFKNNLEVLLLDFKIARQKIEELKLEIREKDAHLVEFSKNISEYEKSLTEAEARSSEIIKPMETKINKYKRELNLKIKEFEVIDEEIEKTKLLNEQLTVDIVSKESIINDLNIKLDNLKTAEESAITNAEMCHRHLGRSQNYIKELITENKILKNEIQVLKKKNSEESASDKFRTDKEKKVELDSQERTIENLKNHIILRDQKLHQTEEELRVTAEVLHKFKRDFVDISKEKSNLLSEIAHLRNKLSDKVVDVKHLKEKLGEAKKECGEIKRELNTACIIT